MAEADTDLPKNVVKRLVKAHLEDDTKNYQLNADALMAFCESAKYFISYLTAAANDVCKEKKRQTISADDVMAALEELELQQFIGPLKEALEGFKQEQKEKNSKRAEHQKKRKAAAGEAGEAGAGAGAGSEEEPAAKQQRDSAGDEGAEEEDEAGSDGGDAAAADDE